METTAKIGASVGGAGERFDRCVLTINGGSSSIKFALYSTEDVPSCLLSGKVERIGLDGARFKASVPGKAPENLEIDAPDHKAAGTFLIDWLERRARFDAVGGIGHRVVHGGSKYAEPQRVTKP